MLSKKNISIFFIFLIYNISFANSDIKITLDLGGTEFEYLEPIYVKVFIENRSNDELIIESWTGTPDFEFILKNNKGEIFQKTIVDNIARIWKTTYYIEAGVEAFFPEGFSYYSMSDYYYIKNSLHYLPEDIYTLDCGVLINNEIIKAKTVEFKVVHPKNLTAFNIFEKSINSLSPENYDLFVKKMESIFEIKPNSVYHSLALDYMYMISIWGQKKYENREVIINKMINQINKLPENRYTYYKFIKNYLLHKSKRTDEEKKLLMNKLASEVENNKLQRYINNYLNNKKQEGFRIEKIKVEQIPPPPNKNKH